MSAATADVVSPAPAEADELAKVLSFIEAHEARPGTSPEPAFFLSGAGEHDRVELTEHRTASRDPQASRPGPGIVGYVHRQLGLPIASTAPLGGMTEAFGEAMRRFAVTQGVPWVDFVKGQRKDDVMHQHLARFEAAGGTEGVLFVGRAQEKTSLFRTEKRRNAEGVAYPWIVKTTGLINHFYVRYRRRCRLRAVLPEVLLLFPNNARLCL